LALLGVALFQGNLASARSPEPVQTQRPLPISAHNCYPQNSASNARLIEALGQGIDNIEIDLGWDAAERRLIVGHDAEPRPGVEYPELASYLVPALEAHWRTSRADGAPTVLTVDWKTRDPAAMQAFHAFLEAHPDWYSSAPKSEKSPLTTRRLTVCLTGDEEAKRHYDSLVPSGGVYRAFADLVFGAGSTWRSDAAAYNFEPATAFRRFLTFYWGIVERRGPPLAAAWTDSDAARLAALVTQAHQKGYRVRFYTLNGHLGPLGNPYRFASDEAARTRWLAARAAGADWIATDEYAEIVKAFQAPETSANPQ
jgi:hypothetical protein